MAMPQIEQTKSLIAKHRQKAPEWMQEYIEYMELDGYSYRTILNYLKYILEFFKWAQAEGIDPRRNTKFFYLESFTKLRKAQVLRYFETLKPKPDKYNAAKNALSSLSDWLLDECEDTGLYRNLFRQVRIIKNPKNMRQRGLELKEKLFLCF